MAKLLSLIITVIMLFESVPLVWVPTLTVDAGDRGDDVSNYATGFLYGLAEPGVPSEAMTDSLDISTVSQKVVGGLQHPTGDVDRVAPQLENCDYRVVYLQDSFDTWYYCHKEIAEMREQGTYDWREFLYERYLPIVEEKVTALSQKDYADDIVYCIFNECDNGIWFGNYDEDGEENFYEAWKITYDLVKSIDPDAKIGGPGYFDYVTEKIDRFLAYTKENGCVPDIMIYHELSFWCSVEWPKHVEDYRRIEKENGISELPVIVTEYGAMDECGNPAAMVRYIVSMEKTNTYGDMAFWRLSNNLNDTCADDNSPNSNWWLYRKYAEMEGSTLAVSTSALDEDRLFDHDWWYHYTGIASLTSDGKEINVICNGSDNKKAVRIKNIDETQMGKIVDVTVECVYFSGLTGIVSEPYTVRKYKTKVMGDSLNINIPGTDTDTVYFVSVKEHTEEFDAVRNTNLPVRYEFEDGKLLGSAYTYDSAYATTGEVQGMCGGFENEGDGVKITVNAKEKGLYRLDIIYGKHNDSGVKNGRDYGVANFTLDGKTTELMLENTIKSEYTTMKTVYVDLCMGRHTIEFSHNDGTFVLDSLLMSRAVADNTAAVLEDSEDGTEYLAVAPEDGYYYVSLDEGTYDIAIDGAKAVAESGSTVYLRRGLNEIALSAPSSLELTKAEPKVPVAVIGAEDITVSDGAEILTDKYGNTYLGSIAGGKGKGTFKVAAPEGGDYRVTVLYSNNSEGGYHDYNVDLIERYLTVSVNGAEGRDIFFRNTYSDYTYKTATFNVTLEEGENEIAFTNSGEYSFASLTPEAPFVKTVTVNRAVS
ncbi:MAG: hypothetical protein E7543_03490 [Ruminococcaceae bacterium]|nr:hypothetical protein [Oscillospiraceae bacterium]